MSVATQGCERRGGGGGPRPGGRFEQPRRRRRAHPRQGPGHRRVRPGLPRRDRDPDDRRPDRRGQRRHLPAVRRGHQPPGPLREGRQDAPGHRPGDHRKRPPPPLVGIPPSVAPRPAGCGFPPPPALAPVGTARLTSPAARPWFAPFLLLLVRPAGSPTPPHLALPHGSRGRCSLNTFGCSSTRSPTTCSRASPCSAGSSTRLSACRHRDTNLGPTERNTTTSRALATTRADCPHPRTSPLRRIDLGHEICMCTWIREQMTKMPHTSNIRIRTVPGRGRRPTPRVQRPTPQSGS